MDAALRSHLTTTLCIAVLSLVTLSAHGQTAEAPAYCVSDMRPLKILDLDRLKWGMTAQQVKAAYPSLGDRYVPRRWYHELSELRTSYKVGACTYTIAFSGNFGMQGAGPLRVYEVYLDPDDHGSQSCSNALRADLIGNFGVGRPLQSAQGSYIDWYFEGTVVRLNPAIGSLTFLDLAGDNLDIRDGPAFCRRRID